MNKILVKMLTMKQKKKDEIEVEEEVEDEIDHEDNGVIEDDNTINETNNQEKTSENYNANATKNTIKRKFPNLTSDCDLDCARNSELMSKSTQYIINKTSKINSNILNDQSKADQNDDLEAPLAKKITKTTFNNILSNIGSLNTGHMKSPINLLFKSFSMQPNPKNPKTKLYKLLFTDGIEQIQLVEWNSSSIAKSHKVGQSLTLNNFRIIQEKTDQYYIALNEHAFQLSSNISSSSEISKEIVADIQPINFDQLVMLNSNFNKLITVQVVLDSINTKKLNNTTTISCLAFNQETFTKSINCILTNINQSLKPKYIYTLKNIILSNKDGLKLISSPFTQIEQHDFVPNFKSDNAANISYDITAIQEVATLDSLDDEDTTHAVLITGKSIMNLYKFQTVHIIKLYRIDVLTHP